MHTYDFEKFIDRTGTGASKWDKMYRSKPDVTRGTVPFSVADMEFLTAPEIVEGLKDFIDSGILGYVYPYDTYYEAVLGWMKKRHNWDIDRKWIVCTPGVVPALYQAVKSFTNEGDGVILMPPVYYPFFTAIEHSGRKAVRNSLVNRNGRYEIDFDDFEQKAKRPENKLLLFCSPHNPVGRVWTREELERLGQICLENSVFVVSDEIHFDLLQKGYTHTVFSTLSPEIAENCMVCTAPSKTFNIAGLQTANNIIPNAAHRQKFFMDFERGFSDWNLPVLGGKACELAYTKAESWLDAVLEKSPKIARLSRSFLRKNFRKSPLRHLKGLIYSGLISGHLAFRIGIWRVLCSRKRKFFLTRAQFSAMRVLALNG
jgi:bifunctional pyridoxal-dependent enzyme with beta-cystathionase and maltose regulon repressor activities